MLTAPGAILVLGDHTKSTNGDETFSEVFNSGNPLFNFTEGDVYVSFDLTFTNPDNPGVLITNQSFGGYSHSGGDNFGQNWQQTTIGVIYYGQRDDIAGQTITPGERMTLVVKYELNGPGLDGDTIKFWVNPVLGTGIEPTPDDADPSRIWNPAAISSDDMRFRRGNDPNTNVMTFENVTVYSGGDSPFADPNPKVVYPFNIDVSSNDSTTTRSIDVEISNNGISPDLGITGIQVTGTNAGLFTVVTPASPGSPFQIAEGTSGTLELSFDPSGTTGEIIAALEITSNDPGSPRSIPIKGTIRDPWIDSVANVNLPLLTSNSPEQFDVAINNLGANDLLVDGASLSGLDAMFFSVVTDFTNPLVIAPGSSASVTFRFDPDGMEGLFNAILEFESNDALEPIRSVPVTAAYQFIPTPGKLVLGGHTKTTAGDETFSEVFNNGSTLFNFIEGNVYVTFDLTFTNPANPGVLSTSQSFGGYSHSVADNFGQNWEQSTIGVNYYGQRDDIAGQTITPGEPITLVVKYELNNPGLDGDTVKFWVNPVLGTGVEPTPDDAGPTRIWNPAAISSDDMRFRLGNAPNTNVMTYENVTVYSGGDSPFAIPTVVYPPHIDVSSNDSNRVQAIDVEISNLIVSPSLDITGIEVMGQDAGLFTVVSSASPGSPFQIAEGATGTVKLSFDPSGFVGNISAVLKITSNDPGPARIIPIGGLVRDPWIASVDNVTVTLPNFDSPTEFDVTLSNLGTQDLEIDGAFSSGLDWLYFSVVTDFSSPLVIAAGASANVRFRIDPDGENREFTATLEFDSNDDVEPIRFVSVTAAGASADFTSWALGFGIPDDPNDDSDFDGIPALVEYALGYDPTAFDTLPSPVASGPDFTITWPKGTQAAADPQISYVVQISEDLVGWGPPAAANLAETATELVLTLPGGDPRSFARISVVRTP